MAQNVFITVMSLPTAQAISAAAVAGGLVAPVHIKVDTGMGRYGLLPDEVVPFALALRDLPGLRIEGLWTHFATAEDEDDEYLHRQLNRFLDVDRALREQGHPRAAAPLRKHSRRRSATPSHAWIWCAWAWPPTGCTLTTPAALSLNCTRR